MDVESTYSEFITCDRAGRRNAVPDIKEESSTPGVRELSENMGDLSIQGAEGQAEAAASNSGQEQTPEAQDGSTPS
ncbi:cAMP-dependent protein kinase inhibitor gamma [Hyla sarda]|uniref:cAMP-dependent protein kinase inhibitor gamma n=1 Tax=Hyla sarda TaxID=327740 RepID=UPI0024C47258|nr:cAMP-dependent protein kinase inhibitor gamma [Hyla sarda]XP_056404460.1 cAMP-dependent protein kinase inhibitor gamma [Hyla sarda]XP_056404461.1 cAMP-dependent protein kinase inhibitor gamma [Hyla sarda]XP_056404462.1 cAMP-dependent protein kinase inhibitor gamma [Hyla sarda]XP_056404463.1 cAMP-dependent protein kinase inhibitor gamma [Hyla sarda]